jgi:hypothetical protein
VVEEAWHLYRDFRLKPILDTLTRAARPVPASEIPAPQRFESLVMGHWRDPQGEPWLLPLPWSVA